MELDTGDTTPTERCETVVVGGGQAGLSVGYHLARRKRPFLILEAGDRIGDVWRRRWDSLRLFTPARFNGLDGMPFPARPHYFPTKDEMGDYLEAYARRFELPVRTGTRVHRVSRRNGRFEVMAGDQRIEADNVVIAMANYQRPRVPPFAAELDPDIVQLHSIDYRNPAQLREGAVLVAGAGNSGSEVAMEVSRSHRTWLSGRDTGHLPFRIERLLARFVFQPLILRVLFHRVLTVDTPPGRKMRPKVVSQGGPLIRVKPRDLAARGVVRAPKTTGVRDGLPELADGRVLDVANVIWCTGFNTGFSWIDLPVFDDRGAPLHERGIVSGEPGLFFVGLHFLYSLSSVMIHGVGRDAARIADAIAARPARSRPRAASFAG